VPAEPRKKNWLPFLFPLLYIAPLMRKVFVSNLVLVVALNLLVKPFYLLIVETEIQNRTGEESFGIYFALIGFSFLLNILPDMGITNWNTRHLSRHPDQLKATFKTTFRLRLWLGAAYLVLALCGGLIVGYHSEQLLILAFLSLNQVLSLGIFYLRSHFSGLHRFRQDSILSILDRLLLSVFLVIVLWGTDLTFRIEWLVYAQTAAYLISFLIGWWMLQTLLRQTPDNGKRPQQEALLRESAPYATLILISAICYRADGVMLERLDGAVAAGHYAMAFRFFEAVNMVSYLFASLLLPLFTSLLHRHGDVNPLVSISLRLMCTGGLLLLAMSVLWGDQIMALFYDAADASTIMTFQWLMFGVVLFSLQYVYGTLITAAGHLRKLAMMAAAGLVVNLCLNAILIPAYSHTGSAIANVASQGLVLALQWWYSHRKLNIRSGADSLKIALFALLLFAGASLFLYLDLPEQYGWYGMIAFFAAFGSVAVTLGLVKPQMLWQN
jgi:O-antigen/teichoic acid export membrane protein